MLATCSSDGTVRLWGSMTRHLPGVVLLANDMMCWEVAGDTFL